MAGVPVRAQPGDSAGCDLHLHNPHATQSDVAIEIKGAPRAWGWVTPAQVSLAPLGDRTVRLVFRPPREAGLVPGPVPFEVTVGSSTLHGAVEVGDFVDLSASLAPKAAAARRETRYQLTVENRGNVEAEVCVEASPSDGRLSIGVEPATLSIGPGASGNVRVTARATRPQLSPRTRGRAFTVTARQSGRSAIGTKPQEATPQTAIMYQRPFPWAVPAAVIGAVMALVALLVRPGGEGGSPAASSGPPAQSAQAPSPPSPVYAVGSRTVTFVDPTRKTNAFLSFPERPERTLRTWVLYPAEGTPATEATPVYGDGLTPATARGPFPMIVFAHGSGGNVEGYRELLVRWAAAGYVVAAPTFPGAASPPATTSDDYPDQPGDMSYVAGEMVRLSGSGIGPFANLVDPARIGAAGHSLGGVTTLGLIANACCSDPRFKAGVVLAGREVPFGNHEFFTQPNAPLLFVHGDRDGNVSYSDGKLAYVDAQAPKHFVTVEGGGHGRPFQSGVDQTDFRVVLTTTLDFFDHYLRGAANGLDRLRAHASVAGVSHIESTA